MRSFSLAELARWTRGEVHPASAAGTACHSVSTDTRNLQPGALFVALRGDRFDGHGFLEAASEAGAAAALVDTADRDCSLPQVCVADTLLALGELGRENRLQSPARLIGVTGSSGKTTVKEILAAILCHEGKTLATEGNLNNHIGVPLTLMRLAPEHRFGVIEMGASAVGEIAYTVGLAQPSVALITNAGEAHLEGFGSYQNIVLAKGEIIEGVPADGTVVLNADDPACADWVRRAGKRRVVTVSAQGNDADLRCLSAKVIGNGYELEVAVGPDRVESMTLALPGEHNISNALLAMAAAMAAGAALESVRAGLAEVRGAAGRLQIEALNDRITLIDDSYNANPTSMKAALRVLAGMGGRRYGVLGPMAELGCDSRSMHVSVGEAARDLGIERLLLVGDERCEGYLAGFGEGAEHLATHEQAVERLLSDNDGPLTVLVKGSRSSAMDRVAKALKEKVTNSCCSG